MISIHVKNESHQRIPAPSTLAYVPFVIFLEWASCFCTCQDTLVSSSPDYEGRYDSLPPVPPSMRCCLEGGGQEGEARSSAEPGKDSLQTQTSTTSLQNVCTLEEIVALCAAAKVSCATVPPVVVMLFKKKEVEDQGWGNPLGLSDIGPDEQRPPLPSPQ